MRRIKKRIVLVSTLLFLLIHTIKKHITSDSNRILHSIYKTSNGNSEKKDWHDWEFIFYESLRKGPGEQGKPYEINSEFDLKLSQSIFQVEGLYALVSDKISVNRSVPDLRFEE